MNSDHRSLYQLHNLKEPNGKPQRRKIRLNEYDFDIKYIFGKENNVADSLVNIEECNVNGETASIATIHFTDEDSEEFIRIADDDDFVQFQNINKTLITLNRFKIY